MIFHPHYGGVTIHRPEDVDISYNCEPVAAGYRETTGLRFWRMPIKAPAQERSGDMALKKKLSLVERLLLSKAPKVAEKHLSAAKQLAHNVYDLPSIKEGIRWMHAACGYPAKSTWIKAIRNGNYAGWPLLSVENVHKHYPETDETPMGRLNQSRTNVRSTNKKRVPLPDATASALAPLVGKKKRDVYVKIVDTHDMKNTIYSDQNTASKAE